MTDEQTTLLPAEAATDVPTPEGTPPWEVEAEKPPETPETAISSEVDAETDLARVEASERKFDLLQRQAASLAASSLVPKEYQGTGKQAIANVMIAVNMAKRMNADPLQVMQNLHVIHGRPSWSAQFLIATFNGCGRYTSIRYRFADDRKSCTAVTTEKATGEELEGTPVTMDMADAEGWSKKAGSKWKTMPEQMLRYRSAAFLIRAIAPELALGMYTTDEVEDFT